MEAFNVINDRVKFLLFSPSFFIFRFLELEFPGEDFLSPYFPIFLGQNSVRHSMAIVRGISNWNFPRFSDFESSPVPPQDIAARSPDFSETRRTKNIPQIWKKEVPKHPWLEPALVLFEQVIDTLLTTSNIS